jgi:methionine-rich copper-binding protein CopC
MLFVLACGLSNGIQQIQQAVTQLPDILTSAPTALGAIETMAASAMPPSNCPATPSAGGLGISVDTAKSFLQMSQQFAFADGTAEGKPALIATLTPAGATNFPDVAQGFSAQFIGDVCNLSRIMVTVPRSDQQTTVDQGNQVLNLVLTGTLPLDVQLTFFNWLSQNYSTVEVAGQQQTTIKNMQFTLQRNQTSMILDIVPAK